MRNINIYCDGKAGIQIRRVQLISWVRTHKETNCQIVSFDRTKIALHIFKNKCFVTQKLKLLEYGYLLTK
jgi:hypothetical protein